MAAYEQKPADNETFPPPLPFEVFNRCSNTDADEFVADYADMSEPVKELICASLAEGEAAPEPGELLRDIGRRLKPESVLAVYDAWTRDVSFDPAEVKCEEAAWIAMDGQANQAAFKVHLAEDEDSPCGFGWYTEPSYWDAEERCWKPDYDAGGIWWGYRDAAALEAEFPECENVNWQDEFLRIVRVEPELLDELGIGDDVERPRPASVQELDAAFQMTWPDASIRYPHIVDLSPSGTPGRDETYCAGLRKGTRIVLKEDDGTWTCAVTAKAQGQSFLVLEMAETFMGAYSGAFDALSAKCSLHDVELLAVSPLNPSRPFKSIEEMCKYDGIGADWEPPHRQEPDEPRRCADAPTLAAPLERAAARSAR